MKRITRRAYKFLRKHIYILIIFILFLSWFVYSYFSEGIVFHLSNSDISEVTEFIDSFGNWAEIIFVLLVIIEVVLAPVPPLGLYLVAGILFGGFLGGFLTLIGNTTGAFIAFKIARRLGENFSKKHTNERIKKKFDKFFEKYGGISIFILRINPLTTSDLVSYLAGLTKIKTRTFVIATTLGLAPMIFVQTYFGEIFIKNNPILSAIVIFITILYIFVFLYLILKAISKNKSNKELKKKNN